MHDARRAARVVAGDGAARGRPPPPSPAPETASASPARGHAGFLTGQLPRAFPGGRRGLPVHGRGGHPRAAAHRGLIAVYSSLRLRNSGWARCPRRRGPLRAADTAGGLLHTAGPGVPRSRRSVHRSQGRADEAQALLELSRPEPRACSRPGPGAAGRLRRPASTATGRDLLPGGPAMFGCRPCGASRSVTSLPARPLGAAQAWLLLGTHRPAPAEPNSPKPAALRRPPRAGIALRVGMPRRGGSRGPERLSDRPGVLRSPPARAGGNPPPNLGPRCADRSVGPRQATACRGAGPGRRCGPAAGQPPHRNWPRQGGRPRRNPPRPDALTPDELRWPGWPRTPDPRHIGTGYLTRKTVDARWPRASTPKLVSRPPRLLPAALAGEYLGGPHPDAKKKKTKKRTAPLVRTVGSPPS